MQNASAAQLAYDNLGRLVGVVYSHGRVDFVYDASGNLIEQRVNGAVGLNLTTAASPTAGGSIALLPQQSGYVAGDVITASATANPGYRFLNWSGLPACGAQAACTFTMPSGNVNLTANFEAISTLLPIRTLVAPAGGGAISPAPNPAGYPAGAQVSLTAVPADGYVIDSWFGGACTSYSGSVCTFTMPATPVDVFVRFRKTGGTGYMISTAEGFMNGVGNPHVAGMVEVSPYQDRVAAGTPITLTVHPASNYRLRSVDLYVDGVTANTLCPDLYSFNQNYLPGRPRSGSCSFPMPAGNLYVATWFDPYAPHYILDNSAVPQNGGGTEIRTVPTGNLQWYHSYDELGALRLWVEAGVSTTLVAKPAGARQFVRWVNGPCAGSANPVCSFTMPASALVATPEFTDEPASSCTYAVQRPSGYVPAGGGERSYTITTQPGCHYNAAYSNASSLELVTLSTTASGITLNFQPNPTVYPQEGVLRVHTGREVFNFSVVQAGTGGGPTFALPPLNMGPLDAGEFAQQEQAFTITNPTAKALALSRPVTNGPFAVVSNTCPASLPAGASCQVQLGFAPRKAGSFTGEFILPADGFAWIAPTISGTAHAGRENVASAVAGGRAIASSRQSVIETHESAAINGDRRGELDSDQGVWHVRSTNPAETLELRFARPREVSRLMLFGRDGSRPLAAEPWPGQTVTPSGIPAFRADYWTGTTWAPVTELAKTSGDPHRVQRLEFAPVTTDRLRVTIDTVANQPTTVAEAEVWTVQADTGVEAFTFASVNPANPDTLYTSNLVTPVGFNVAVPITVSNGSYSIGCAEPFTTAAGSLQPGESVCVRNTSPGPAGGSTVTTLTVGDQTATYTTTVPAPPSVPSDVTPYEVPPQLVAGVRPGTAVLFAPITVAGIDAPAGVTVANGDISVGCTGTFTRAATTVTNGAVICVAHTSAPSLATTVTTTVTVGTVQMSFSSVTVASADPGDGTPPGTVTQTLTVVQGWNLLGNGVAQGIPVADLGGPAQIESVWRWNAATRKWAFYSPELSSTELAAYAQRFGYEILDRIEPNQGFWLKAKTAVQLHGVNGTPLALAAGDLPTGWHLLSSGTAQSPEQLAPVATASSEARTQSIWAWEPAQKKWFFYAPELAALGGTALRDYINQNGYLDFGQANRKLDLGTGLWVNRTVAVGPPSFSLRMDEASFAAAGAVSNGAHQFITGRNNGAAVKFSGLANPGTVRIPNRPELQFTTGATFDIWARIDSAVGMDGYGRANSSNFAMVMLAKSHDRTGVAFSTYNPTEERGYGQGAFATYDQSWGSPDCVLTNHSPKVALGEWHRLTAVASASSGVRIYLNKSLVMNCPGARPDFSAINREDLFLGTYSDGFWYPLNGALQDLHLYQRALTPAEVQALP